VKISLPSQRRSSPAKVKPARLRNISPRLPRRSRRGRLAAPSATQPEVLPLPLLAQPEPEPRSDGESVRGDSLQLYLREIGQVKLLTPAEEIILANI